MKRILMTLVLALSACGIASAFPLFPYFVDLVGNYDEVELPGAKVCMKGRTNGGGPVACKAFLEDTLPEGVNQEEVKKSDGRVIHGYWTTMEDGIVSVIYFVTKADGTFSVEYAEGSPETVLSTFKRK